MKNRYLLITFCFALIDQLLKVLARRFLIPHHRIDIIPDVLYLTLVENKGVSYGTFSNLNDSIRTPLLVGIQLVIIIGIFIYLNKYWSKLFSREKFGFTLILGGAFGNLWGRAFRQSVTDFMAFDYGFDFLKPLFVFFEKPLFGLFDNIGFHIPRGFVNNFADDIIFIGFLILIFQSQKKNKESKNNESK